MDGGLQVISTDMSKHMDHVASLRTRVEMEALTPSGDEDGKLVLTSNADRVQVKLDSFLLAIHCL